MCLPCVGLCNYVLWTRGPELLKHIPSWTNDSNVNVTIREYIPCWFNCLHINGFISFVYFTYLIKYMTFYTSNRKNSRNFLYFFWKTACYVTGLGVNSWQTLLLKTLQWVKLFHLCSVGGDFKIGCFKSTHWIYSSFLAILALYWCMLGAAFEWLVEVELSAVLNGHLKQCRWFEIGHLRW